MMKPVRLKETTVGYLFVAPLLIGITVITIIPILASFGLSFTNWSLVSGIENIHFIGMNNFNRLFHDAVFMKSLVNNLLLLAALPFKLAFALFLAIIINKYIYFKDFFKIVYFMPFISGVVAIAIVFRVMFHPTYGPVNNMLMSIGIDHPPGWLADMDFAFFSLIIIFTWIQFGFSFIIYIAGLQNISRELYEAASIDGASAWRQFKHITLPMLSPTTFFLLITGIISSFKIFDLIAVLTEGGPANSTMVAIYYLYQRAFVNLETGYASAISIVIFAFILIITLINWVGQRRWVHQ